MQTLSKTTHSVRGTELAVARLGSGRPIVLVHAYPMRSELYRGVVGPIADAATVVACDNRGFGESPLAGEPLEISDYADDFIAVLDDLDIHEPAVFVGVSMGGYIAMQVAARHVERVAGLLLCHTRAAADSTEDAAKRESLAQKILADGSRVVRGVPEKLLGVTTQTQRPELTEELREWILATDPNGIATALRAMATRPDSTELLKTLDRPVQFVAGSEDTFTPVDEMRSLAAATGRECRVIDAAGHLSPIEQPDSFVAMLQEFLTTDVER